MKIAVFWREQFEKLMRDFALHVGDILGVVMDTLQPRTLEEFEKFSFDMESDT